MGIEPSAVLRQRGLRVTAQRLAVLRAGLDPALRGIEAHNGNQPALAVEEERTRLPVGRLAARRQSEA